MRDWVTHNNAAVRTLITNTISIHSNDMMFNINNKLPVHTGLRSIHHHHYYRHHISHYYPLPIYRYEHQLHGCYSSSSFVRFFATSTSTSTATTPSSGGIFSSISNRLSHKLDVKRQSATEEKFNIWISDMLAINHYTLANFKTFIEENIRDASGGWKKYIGGLSSTTGIEELKKMQSILSSFTTIELNDPHNMIDRLVKIRVAEAAKVSVTDVNFLLRQYDNTAIIHRWIHQRKNEGAILPTTSEELKSQLQEHKPTHIPQHLKPHKPRARRRR